MFGIGASELLVIFLVALLVLGPDKLPEAARTLAKLFGEFRKAKEDLRIGLVGIHQDEIDWRHTHNNPQPRVIEAPPVDPAEKETETVARTSTVARSTSEPKDG